MDVLVEQFLSVSVSVCLSLSLSLYSSEYLYTFYVWSDIYIEIHVPAVSCIVGQNLSLSFFFSSKLLLLLLLRILITTN